MPHRRSPIRSFSRKAESASSSRLTCDDTPRSSSLVVSTCVMPPFCITMRKSESSAMRGSWVTKMKILRCWRSSCIARVRWMPAFSTSSSSTIGVSQITVASAISNARVCPPESSVMRLSTTIGSPVNWLAKSSVRARNPGASPPPVARANASRGTPALAGRRETSCAA